MKSLFAISGLTWLLIGTVPHATAQEASSLDVDEIVRRANHAAYYQGADGRANVQMVITDPSGRERQRRFTILRRDEPAPDAEDDSLEARSNQQFDERQKFYLYFHRPADVRKMVYLVHKHLDRDDDRWLYLPDMDLIKRIAAGDKRTSFVGSDFFYEDVSGRPITDDEHELVDTTGDYYKLRSTPKRPGEVEFDHYITWVHRETFLPITTEYHNAEGTKYRQYTALKVERIQGHPTVVQSQMEDLRRGSQTVLNYSDVTYDLGVPEDVFTERHLRRPPMQWLR
ncbi:MAG: outer membrane lipoprotein-sorting protein [bacterium]